ncbi:hypothetical protein MTO96_005596 [Rhipicephalus appendiculatus]
MIERARHVPSAPPAGLPSYPRPRATWTAPIDSIGRAPEPRRKALAARAHAGEANGWQKGGDGGRIYDTRSCADDSAEQLRSCLASAGARASLALVQRRRSQPAEQASLQRFAVAAAAAA